MYGVGHQIREKDSKLVVSIRFWFILMSNLFLGKAHDTKYGVGHQIREKDSKLVVSIRFCFILMSNLLLGKAYGNRRSLLELLSLCGLQP